MAIRHRNNSLFYRTLHGANVGDVYMTLIHTTVLHGGNPFDYLTALQIHSGAVAQAPAEWLPWNFRRALGRLTGGAPEPQRNPGGRDEPPLPAPPVTTPAPVPPSG